MNNIQYFSNGVRRFLAGGSYKGVPAASRLLDLQFLNDMRKWQNGEIEWTNEMSRYYTNVSTDTKYNKTGELWQEINKNVKTWETPGSVDSQGRKSLPGITIIARHPRDIYGIPTYYSDSDRSFIRSVQERPDYEGIKYGMYAATSAPFLLSLGGLGGSGIINSFTTPKTLSGFGGTSAFNTAPLLFGTRVALTADGTAVAIPSTGMNVLSVLPSLGASSVLSNLLYGASDNAYSRNRVGFNRDTEAEEGEEIQETPSTENNGEGGGENKEPGKFKKGLNKVKKVVKNPWIKYPLIGVGLYLAFNIGKLAGEGNKRLGNPNDAADSIINTQIPSQPSTVDFNDTTTDWKQALDSLHNADTIFYKRF